MVRRYGWRDVTQETVQELWATYYPFNSLSSAVIRSHAERFSKARFQQAMKQTVDEAYQKRTMLV